METESQQTKEKEKEAKSLASKLNIPSVICTTCDIQGNVTFGKGCIVHPGCSIVADGGEIIIGDFNIIEERVVIINKIPKERPPNYVPKPLRIGSYNIFEVGTIIENTDVGDYNMFQHKSHLESNCLVKKGCNVGAGVRVPARTVLEDMTAVYYPCKFVKNSTFTEENAKNGVLPLIEILAKMIPKQNNLKKI